MDSKHDLGHMETNGTTTMMSVTAEIDPFEPKAQVSRRYYIAPLPLYGTEKPLSLNIPVHRNACARQTNVTHTTRRVTFTDPESQVSIFARQKRI